MWELDHKESWVPKNWCFWAAVLEKTLENPLLAKRSNQSILKEISPEYSLEVLIMKLKCQYFGHLMWRSDLLEKTLMLGNIEGRRIRVDRWGDGWMTSPTQWTWVWVNPGSWWATERPGVLQSMGSQRGGCDWVTEKQTKKLSEVGASLLLHVYSKKPQWIEILFLYHWVSFSPLLWF